eukprot:CAMPEP_0118647346 /NCGR_PEP_ID=MMETSP0785-20121206/8554_1 /TAXON_ID=91992 /ORGANISM="Bolidomonas pacifica, Strain CCMP 1866" /LENGTH=85 /DNA_ID=CAMNT_0006539427 /DNA_START=232 /DNA_END=485 /DNA_ORIENTATION=+
MSTPELVKITYLSTLGSSPPPSTLKTTSTLINNILTSRAYQVVKLNMDHLAVVEFVSERLKKRGVQQRVADELAKQVIGDIGDEG